MTSNLPEEIYLHGINKLPNIGVRRTKKILNYFSSAKTAWEATAQDWLKVGLEDQIATTAHAHKTALDLEKEQTLLSRLHINLLSYQDPRYPRLLLEICDFPHLLYYKGALPSPESLNVAVVGTRKFTPYGKTATLQISRELTANKCAIVSGLAYGIDALAHQTCLEMGGTALAVLGSGLDEASFYPKPNLHLARQITDSGGCIFSEYPPQTPPLKQNFIARDRIVSGLSSAVVVVECNMKSGALITAKFALEQNRLLFAVPGPITAPFSEGPNRLIQQGARLLLNASEILTELNVTPNSSTESSLKALPPLNKVESLILQALTQDPQLPDAIVETTGLSALQVTTALGMLELKGIARNLGANQYIRTV